MSIVDLNNYSRIEPLLKSCRLEDRKDQINWLLMKKEEAAVNLAKLYLLAKIALTSNNESVQQKLKSHIDLAFNEIGNRIHVFAKEEGRVQLGFKHLDIARLFNHIELGGHKYQQQSIQQ